MRAANHQLRTLEVLCYGIVLQQLSFSHPEIAMGEGAVGPVRKTLLRKARALTGPDAWGIDDTGFVKDGHSSPCVARQYSGDRRVVLLRPHSAGGGRPRRIRSHHRPTRRRRACNIAPAGRGRLAIPRYRVPHQSCGSEYGIVCKLQRALTHSDRHRPLRHGTLPTRRSTTRHCICVAGWVSIRSLDKTRLEL